MIIGDREIGEIAGRIRTALDILCREKADLDFFMEGLLEAFRYCMKNFCPYKAEDRVLLIKTPVITETVNHRWYGSKHFLVAGAKGTVVDASCDKNGFGFYIVFDDDSFIHPVTKETIARKGNERNRYFFRQEYLTRDYPE